MNQINTARAVGPSHEELRRMDVVRRYDILDTPPDGAFDRVTALAARLFQVPIAIISIVDHDRIWFKSHHGLDLEQIPREPGLCASAIMQDQPWILSNASTDARSLANPLVASEAGMRFYVGIPLRTSDGYNLGTLCVLDHEPHPVSQDQVDNLADLASVVMDQLELRLSARRAIAAKDAALAHSELMAREIDHRVMNSLQFISTMLEVQGQFHENTAAGLEINRAAGRINAIAHVHQHIHQNENFEDADAVSYLRRLCEDLSWISGIAAGQVDVGGAGVRLPTESLVSIGLIVNELVTNAVKHGASSVVVGLDDIAEDEYRLSVTDNGPGVPDGFDSSKSSGLGLKVVSSLVGTLGGRIAFEQKPARAGTAVTIFFGKMRKVAH